MVAIVAAALLQPAVLMSVKPVTMHVPFVEEFKICWNVASNFEVEISLASEITEANDVVG